MSVTSTPYLPRSETRRRDRRAASLQPRRTALALAAALLVGLAAAPAAATTRYWNFIGGCSQADWLGMTSGANAQGAATCWSEGPGRPTGLNAPTAGEDAFILAPDATATLLVEFAAPQRLFFTGTARDLQVYGSKNFAAGLNITRNALNIGADLWVGATGSALLGRIDQSGGQVLVGGAMSVFSGDYNLSGGTLNAKTLELRSQLVPARLTQTGGTLVAGVLNLGADSTQAATFSQLAGDAASTFINVGTVPGAGTSTLALRGSGATWNNSGTANIGAAGIGALEISGGARMTTTDVAVGASVTGNGRVLVSELGSKLRVNGTLSVGGFGSALLQVQQAGSLSAAAAVFSGAPVDAGAAAPTLAVLQGAGSIFNVDNTLVVGGERAAGLQLADGATLSNALGVVGRAAGTQSFVDLVGAGGANWTNRTGLVVGEAGWGRVGVGAHNTLSSPTAVLGQAAGSEGRVDVAGAGAQWLNSGALAAGSLGHGSIALSGAGTLNTPSLVLGEKGQGRGDLYVSGAGTQATIAGLLSVGRGGRGSVVVSGGTLVTAQGVLGEQAGGSGEATLQNVSGRWTNGGDLVIGQAGTGSVTLYSSAILTTPTLTLGREAGGSGALGLQGFGSAAATVQVNGPLVVGGAGTGSVRVGRVSNLSSGDTVLGRDTGSAGQVIVASTPFELPARWDTSALQIGVAGSGLVAVGSNGEVNVDGLTSAGSLGQLVLDSGTLRSGAVALGGPARLDWRSGLLNVTGPSGAALDGVSLPTLLELYAGRTLQVNQTLALGSASILLLSGGSLSAGTLMLDNAVLASTGGGANALNMDGIGTLVGQGQVGAAVQGGTPATSIQATGPMTLGLLTRSDGFAYRGALVSQGQQVLLLDRDLAELGASTQLLGNAMLVTVNGARLGAGRTLQSAGSVSVQGRFVNDGAVTAQTGVLSFVDDVTGKGSFAGNVRFLAGYAPGNSTAEVHFGAGAVSFGSHAVLTLELNGTVPGLGFDRLADIGALDFQGALVLQFGAGFSAPQGTTLSLLDFDSFQGRLGAAQVSVLGYDAAALDLSRLAVDGTITITAVPEPATLAQWAAGLGVLVFRARRAPRRDRECN